MPNFMIVRFQTSEITWRKQTHRQTDRLVGRVSPPTVSRIETANDLYTTVTHIPKEHLSIKYPSGKCLVMQEIDFIVSL